MIDRKDGTEAKVTPEALTVIYLDEISGRLSDLCDLLEAERSEGEVTRKDISVTGDSPVEYDIRRDEGVEFFMADIYNDGPNTAHIRVDRRTGKEVTLRNNEGVHIDRTKSRKRLHWLYFRTASGETAEVRVIGQW